MSSRSWIAILRSYLTDTESREEANRPYRCASCHRRFELNRQYCTGCGSYRIERACYEDLLETD